MKHFKKQNFKFVVTSRKFGNGKIENISAYTLIEALGQLYSQHNKLPLTITTLISPFHQVVTNFDFNYEGEFYKNFVDSIYTNKL